MYYAGSEDGELRLHYRYVVFNTYQDPVRDEIDRQKDAFAEDLGSAGVLEEAFESYRADWARAFLAKQWPEDIRRRIDADREPLILVTENGGSGFAGFDPGRDRWAIIWFSQFEGSPYDIKPLFMTLARKTRDGEDVIQYLIDVAVRDSERHKAGKIARFFARGVGYVDWRPSIPFIGLSIDVKAILADLAGALD